MPDEKPVRPDFDPPINPEDEHPIESLPGADETQPLEAIAEPFAEEAAPVEAAPEAIPYEAAPVEGLPHSPQYKFDIGEEFGTAKRNLPPAKVVLIALGVIAVVFGIYALTHRTKPLGTGGIDDFTAVAVPDQNLMLVAINVTLTNTGEKALYIHTLKGILKTDSGEFEDEPVSQVDYKRYFQAFPALGVHAQNALLPETKILPGDSAHGTVLVSFPVTQDVFDKRKSLNVSIQPYDQVMPVVLTK
jgi:hypothetical protein